MPNLPESFIQVRCKI